MLGTTFYGNNLQAPRWMGDYGTREHLEAWPALLDPTQFTDSSGVPITVTASAIQGATSVTVSALTPSLYPATTIIGSGNILIPNGSVIDLGGAKFARLAADAKVGDTTLTVSALPTALAGTETGVYNPYPNRKTIPSGTIVGRTFAQRDAGNPFHAGLVTDDELFLVAYDVIDANRDSSATLYRHRSLVKENYLPNYATLSAAGADVQTITITGTPTGGTFTLTFNGATTTPLAFNASTAAVQTALQALGTIGASNATVTGTAGTSYVVTFAAALAGVVQPLIQADGSSLTGGTPAIAVAHTTTGGTPLLSYLRTFYRCIKGKD